MAVFSGPKVSTSGLVFNYNQDSIKSYKGPTIQNLAASIGYNNSSATGISIAGAYETVNVPQIGELNATASVIQNNYNVFSPNSGDCCPSPFFYGNGLAVTPSTLYTYAIVYKVLSDYTNANYMYRYEFTSNGGTLVIEQGIHSDSNRIHLGDGWYWAWGTFTTAATTNWIGYHGAFYYRYSSIPDKMWIARVLLTPGNFTSLHPKYWPNVNTTRSSTQTLFDLTNRSTVTATSLTHTSNGTFSFDGTSSGITTSADASTLGISNDLTISIVTRRAASPTNALQGQAGFGSGGSISIKNSSYYFADAISTNSTRYILPITPAGGSMTPYENVWVNLCVTVSGTSVITYLNGVLASNQTMDGNLKAFPTEVFGLGNGYGYFRTQGNISIAQVYNRALTAAEISQNFQAIRGKYGI